MILQNSIKCFLLAILLNYTQARVYDIATYGDTYYVSKGTILQYDDQSRALSILYTFQNNATDGVNPIKLIQNDIGDVLGITESGGSYSCIEPESNAPIGCGTIFSISNGVYTQLHQFGAANDGKYPVALVKGSFNSVDMIYGITQFGGINNCGTIFSVDLVGNYSKLYDFTCSNGTPTGSLVYANDGYFYGVTSDSPNLYRFDPSTNTVTILTNPLPIATTGDLENIGGILYGISNQGGNGTGFIYSITTTGSNFKVVYNFDKLGTSGVGYPYIITSDDVDNIYGYAKLYPGSNYFGAIFKYTISTNSFSVLYNSNNSDYVTSSLKYDFLNNALLGTTWLPAVNFFTSSITKVSFNNLLQVSDPKYGYSANDVIALK